MSLIYSFKDEINMIKNDKIREFTVESLNIVPEFYEEVTGYIDYTKKVVEYSTIMLDALGSDDIAYDMLISCSLLQDITRYIELDDELTEDYVHPLSVRGKLYSLQGIVGVDMFDDLLRIVESSHGFHSPIPQVEPRINDPVHVWILPFANQLAKTEEDDKDEI